MRLSINTEEVEYTKAFTQGDSVSLWINGQLRKGKVASKGIAPCDASDL